MSQKKALPAYQTFGAAAFASSVAELCTIPIDTAKVRLQVQKTAAGAKPKYSGLFGTIKTIAAEEGMANLWKGIVPGVHRQVLFGGLRIGMYEPVRNFYVGKNHEGPVPLYLKIAASLTSGAGAIAIASPTDLVKVRMQNEGKLAAGVAKKYTSAMGAYGTIAKEEGVAALWTGVGPNMMRNAVINAAELATYDQIKETFLASGVFEEGVPLTLASSLSAGFVAVCVGSPLDVMKSRMMGDAGAFSSPLDCFLKTLKVEGPLAFYKGFVPNYARIGSWNVVMFLTLEQIKSMLYKNQ